MSAESVGILGVATDTPDGGLTAAELAALQDTSEAEVRRVIGNSRILVSSDPAESSEGFAIRAARKCLAAAAITPEHVDAIVFCSAAKRQAPFNAAGMVQHAIGAVNAFATDVGQNCSEVLTGFRLARALIRDDARVRHVLVVCGEYWAEHAPRRGIATITAGTHQNVLSDGGAAALIGVSDRSTLIGFGFASAGQYCDLVELRLEVVGDRAYERARFKDPFPDDKTLALELTRLFRRALSGCLEEAGVRRDEIAHVIVPFSGPAMQDGFARALGLPPERVVRRAGGDPTHIGAPDVLYAFETLLHSGRGRPGDLVLFGARSIGIMRCGVVRL